MPLASITSSVRQKLVKSNYIILYLIVIFLYICQLAYLAYVEKIDITMLVVESLFAFKLLLMYLKHKYSNDGNNDIIRPAGSNLSLESCGEEINGDIQEQPNRKDEDDTLRGGGLSSVPGQNGSSSSEPYP